MTKEKKQLALDWLSPQLKSEVRQVFEPRYQKKLSDDEVRSIANNLAGVIEILAKYKFKRIQ